MRGSSTTSSTADRTRLAERCYAPMRTWPPRCAPLTSRCTPSSPTTPCASSTRSAFRCSPSSTTSTCPTYSTWPAFPVAAERADGMPFVLGGGPCTANPEPVADFFDAILIGDGEASLDAMLDAIRDGLAAGELRRTVLRRLAAIDGVYVPSFYAWNPGSGRPADGSRSTTTLRFRSIGSGSRISTRPTSRRFRSSRSPRSSRTGSAWRSCAAYRMPLLPGRLLEPAGTGARPRGGSPIRMLAQVRAASRRSVCSACRPPTTRRSSRWCTRSPNAWLTGGSPSVLPSLRADALGRPRRGSCPGSAKASRFAPRRLRSPPEGDQQDLFQCRHDPGSARRLRQRLEPDQGLRDGRAPHRERRRPRGARGARRGIPVRAGRQERGGRVEIKVSVGCFVPKAWTPFQWQPSGAGARARTENPGSQGPLPPHQRGSPDLVRSRGVGARHCCRAAIGGSGPSRSPTITAPCSTVGPTI